ALATTSRGSGGSPGSVCRPDGSVPTAAERESERASRVRFGGSLSGNALLRLEPAAADVLRDGNVDPRLMLLLAAMTTAREIAVADFPAVPLDTSGVPRRQVVLTDIDGAEPATSEPLRTWLDAQQAPFLPSVVRPLGPDLLVGFPSPLPSGLLPD
ncbi:MAG: hypothetical protein LH603_16180, partial [Pseudonocardia sp.]|nr:hypothetical protein [Pseudonocardia sp.]